MTTISENDLLVRYDPIEQKLVVYRLVSNESLQARRVLHTEYSLSKLKTMTLGEAGRIVGEDILISISGTREALVTTPGSGLDK